MAHVNSFLRRNRSSLLKIEPRDLTPVQIQILSSSEEKLDQFLSEFKPFSGFAGFNLNLSCPSKDVIRQGKGAAMVKRGAKTQKLVNVIRGHGYPVSVKIRLGLNQLEKDNKLYLNNLGSVDPDFFVVHAKHAGQKSAEVEDYSIYPECVEAARGIPVIANGGVDTTEKVQKLMEMGLAGAMMGRPSMSNPAVFDLFKNEFGFNDPPMRIPNIDDLRLEYDAIFDKIGGLDSYRERFHRVVGKQRFRV
jgi:tRNA-dihydrouridine synthase B